MKKFYSLAILILSVSFVFANPVITSKTASGFWRTKGTWNLNRLPKDQDTVVIPANHTVTVDDVENLSSSTLYIKVYGALDLSKGKLWLNAQSVVVVYAGGSVNGTGNSSETLRINGTDKYWSHVDGIILGPAYADITTGIAPNGFKSGMIVALPVKFLGFTVTSQSKNVLVEWATAQEINSNFFDVQRSENGSDWHTITSVRAAGNSTTSRTYSFTDKTATAQVEYYRIRQVDIDGEYSITPVRTIKNEAGSSEITVNAISNSLYVHFPQQVNSSVIVSLVSMNGQVVSQSNLKTPVGQVVVPVKSEMTGIYVVSVTDGQSFKFSKQVLL